MTPGDTIAAISSAVGPSARIILRLSGPQAGAIAATLGAPPGSEPSSATRARLAFASLDFAAWVYFFRAPRSYTGEDMVEFHIPGNPLLARLLLEELLRRGTRPAEAGEFTARAYLNGRMDLTEAEGVAAAIAARGERELQAARQLLAGELSRRLRPLMDRLVETLALVEAGIDFSDEDVPFISAAEVAGRSREIESELARIMGGSARFEQLTHEPTLVLVGRPNAGKSTLLNALAKAERAVVSPVPGTTRDLISAEVTLDRGIVRLIDAAGVDDQPPAVDDSSAHASIARQMRQRSLEAVEAADHVLLVHDLSDRRAPMQPPRRPDLVILSKLDLAISTVEMSPDALAVSARTGRGLDELRRRLSSLAFGQEGFEAMLALNARHRRALEEGRHALQRVHQSPPSTGAELLALDLREALDALGQVLGQVTPDDVLGRVFATFCIGK